MATYTQRIQELHARLEKNPKFMVHAFSIAPPLPASKLAELTGLKHLPPDLLRFYRETNGMQLVYTRAKNKDFDKDEFTYHSQKSPFLWPNEMYWQLEGCINILPLDILLETDWKDYIWFDLPSMAAKKVTYKGKELAALEFEKKLLPFDVFSKESIAALNVEPTETAVLLSTDHNASYTDYPPITFEAYIKGILATEGLLDKRPSIFR